jgi:hypothetical protein
MVYVAVPADKDNVPDSMVKRFMPLFCHSNVNIWKLRLAVLRSYPERISRPALSYASSKISGRSGVTTAILSP